MMEQGSLLELKGITKQYHTGSLTVDALRGVDLTFDNKEFVAILGPSGCGKTTLLNVIGGLDRYDGGSLVISGKDTKGYTDREWDDYRNHSIGFVFQSYNLIPHQTVLSNVELALTLSGVGREERRKRAMDALTKVSLADQANKKPNELSGGQMQRVAIARALVNNPDIILADEPTGALDSETSLQVMALLKEISRTKLVIMVTHNPELAETFATRIIRLLDGRVVEDSASASDKAQSTEKERTGKRARMRFRTALSLSFTNLLTKKGRTLLTAFAGSIGIIGIALILSISTGVREYIDRVQRDTLSTYPLQIQDSTMDMTAMMLSSFAPEEGSLRAEEGYVRSGDMMSRMLNTFNAAVTRNNLSAFKTYLDSEPAIGDLVTDIRYSYGTDLNIYTERDGEPFQVNPSQVLALSGLMGGSGSSTMELMTSSAFSQTTFSRLDVFSPLLENDDLLKDQYELLAGHFPEEEDELVIFVTRNRLISDYTLYALGLRPQEEIAELTEKSVAGEMISVEPLVMSYDDLLSLRFTLVLRSDFFRANGDGTFTDMTGDAAYLKQILPRGRELKVVGILCPREDAVATQITTGIGYKASLQRWAVSRIMQSDVVAAQTASPDVDVLTGLPFGAGVPFSLDSIDMDSLPIQYRMFLAGKTEEEIMDLIRQYAPDMLRTGSDTTYDENMRLFGVADIDTPVSVEIYARDFESKEKIIDLIENYNASCDESDVIRYTDYVGLIMSSVTTIVNAISYVLIAFVAISLIVSSIMIGVITYISVLERTKEIGILRALGASKSDVARVFNAETLMIGFTSGVLGIVITILLNRVINIIIRSLTGITTIAHLPIGSGVILVMISMFLTFIAGLIPSGMASRKDPVTALRTE